ncbi:MAG: TIGR02611 family protein [Candidatus Saccharimonadaceae bacterium]
MHKIVKNSKKVLVGIIGGLVTLIGFILIPYPGPGWLVVFGGLAILATEFESADRVLKYARGKYDSWTKWLMRQNIFVKISVLAFTGIVVLVTLWLMNGFGLFITLFHLPYPQLVSPLFK